MKKNTTEQISPTEQRRRMMQKLYDSIQRDLQAKPRVKAADQIRSRDFEGAAVRHNDLSTNIDRNVLNNLLLPDILKVEDCIGQSFSSSEHRGDLYQPDAVRGLEIATYVGLRAIEELNYRKDWRYWSGNPSSSDVEIAWHNTWLQTLFRVCLTLPIGYLVSHTRVCESLDGDSSPTSESWQPPAENYDAFLKRNPRAVVRRSSITLAPRLISFSTYLRLFPRKTDEPQSRNAELVPMLALAEADIFDDYPQRENPLYTALDAALKAVFTEDTIRLCLPYWWVYLINHHFLRTPDWIPIDCIVDASCLPEFTEDGVSYESTEEGSDADATEAPAVVTEDPSSPAQSAPIEVDPVDQAKNSAVHLLVTAARKAIASGQFTMNQKGAAIHIYQGTPFLVVPLFFERLSQMCRATGMTEELAHSLLAEKGFLGTQFDQVTYRIFPNGSSKSVGKMTAIPLFPAGIKAFFPSGLNLVDNPDLVLAKQQSPSTPDSVASFASMS